MHNPSASASVAVSIVSSSGVHPNRHPGAGAGTGTGTAQASRTATATAVALHHLSSLSGGVPAPGAHMGGAASLLASPLSIRGFLSASKQSNQTFLQNFILRTRIFKAFIYARANCLGAIIQPPRLDGPEGKINIQKLLLAAAASGGLNAAQQQGSLAPQLSSYQVYPQYLFDSLCVAKLRSKLAHLHARSRQSHVCSHAHPVQFWHGPLSARKPGRFQKRYLALVGRRLMVYKAPLGLLVTNQAALDADPLGNVEPEYVLWEREKGDGGEASVGSGSGSGAAGGSGGSTTAGSSAAGSVAGSAAGSPSFAPASSSSGAGAQSSGPSHATPFSPSSSPPVVSLSAASSPTSSAAAIAALVSSRRALLSTKPPKYLRELRPGVVQLVQPILMDDRGGHAHHGHGAASAATVSSSSEGEGNTFFTFQIIQHPNNTKCVSHASNRTAASNAPLSLLRPGRCVGVAFLAACSLC
jgi:hypothetical protein